MPERSTTTERRLIVVVGMHRSGTSLITRGLRALGVHLGEDLATLPMPDNAKGHWEDRGIVAFNEQLMASLALQWDQVGPDDERALTAPSLAPLVDEATALLRKRLAEQSPWAFKDPRTARLWPFWHRVLAENPDIEAHFVWVIRHPMSVAQSLARRNGCTSIQSHLLWLNHNRIPINNIAAHPHVVVDYDRMLLAPKVELRRIADSLALPMDDAAVGEFVDIFLDPDLRQFHSQSERSAGLGLERVASHAYHALLRVARDELGLGDREFLRQWQTAYREAELFSDAAPRVDVASAEARLRDETAETAERRVGELQKQVTLTLREQFDHLAGRVDNAEARLRDETAETAERRVGELQKQVTLTLREQFDHLAGRVDNAEARLRDETAETAERRARELQEQVALTLREQLDHLAGRVESAEANLGQLRTDLLLANELLNRERYTIFKPLLRRGYRFASKAVARLPAPIAQRLRALKRKLVGRSMPLTVTTGTDGATTDWPTNVEVLRNLARSSDRFDILVCPVIDWHFRIQRPQHIARQLAARGHRVLYLATTFDTTSPPGFSVLESPAPNVALVRLAFPGTHPEIYTDTPTERQRELLIAAIEQLRDAAQLEDLVALVNLPFWRPLVEAIPGCLMVYDCMDYHAGFSTNNPRMIEEETRLLEQADLVFTTSLGLSEIVGETAPNVLVRNAGEIDYFSQMPANPAYPSERPVVGYLGAIADWFDIDLVVAAARHYPSWDFVLVGSTAYCDLSGARKLPNIKLIGEVPYDQAAAWVHSFDVAIIPFILTELTRCTNPVKAYEYLAAGKPVVATDLPEVRLMQEVAHVADSSEAFIGLLELAMAERKDTALASKRRQWASAHDWKDRAERVDEAMRNVLPKVSVIVLTYNNLAFTKACLHSLTINTAYPDWELILVDNASTDGSREFLADYAAANPRTRLVQNDANLGFAAGNNRGLDAATGDYLVVLNNDTYVTRGWLTDLVRHLRRDANLGLVGPVTNNIGNEARIDIQYADMAGMEAAARTYTSSRPRETLEVDVVAFFCAALPRSLFARLGGLDERFGLGFFEDDDYCRRVREAGYRIAIAEDVFVHHHLSASFDALDEKRRQALFERNKALYEEKWGPWTPHRYRDS